MDLLCIYFSSLVDFVLDSIDHCRCQIAEIFIEDAVEAIDELFIKLHCVSDLLGNDFVLDMLYFVDYFIKPAGEQQHLEPFFVVLAEVVADISE